MSLLEEFSKGDFGTKKEVLKSIHLDIATPITDTIDLKHMEHLEHLNKLQIVWSTRWIFNLLSYSRFQTKGLANQFDETSLLVKAAA